MGSCKKVVTPLLPHWSYVFLALTHRIENTNTRLCSVKRNSVWKELIFQFVSCAEGYLYYESSVPSAENSSAILASTAFMASATTCVRFSYHMFGDDVGALDVVLKKEGEGIVETLGTFEGDHVSIICSHCVFNTQITIGVGPSLAQRRDDSTDVVPMLVQPTSLSGKV